MAMSLKKKPKEVGKIRETVPVAKRLKKIQGTGQIVAATKNPGEGEKQKRQRQHQFFDVLV